MTNDRLTYLVKSRSGDGEWKVDHEKRMGLGECNCPNFEKGGNKECFHMRRVNAFMACFLAQEVMKQTLGTEKS